MSGKFELASGKCQGILFCSVCMNPVLVNCLVKLAQEKVWLGEPAVPT